MSGARPAKDTQIVELLGRNRLISDLLQAGLEVALPLRDRGVDLIAYLDLESRASSFIARPIQMKASSSQAFSVSAKYSKIRDLMLAFVWNLASPDRAVTYALSYPEAVAVADRMGWTKTDSWRVNKAYSTSQPSEKLIGFLAPHKMSPAAWLARITEARSPQPV
jgi:hypothetical protein